MVVLVLVRRLGFLELLRALYAELPRLAHTRAKAAFAPALTPMLVVLLPLFCSEPLFPLCSGRSRRMRSCRIGDL